MVFAMLRWPGESARPLSHRPTATVAVAPASRRHPFRGRRERLFWEGSGAWVRPPSN